MTDGDEELFYEKDEATPSATAKGKPVLRRPLVLAAGFALMFVLATGLGVIVAPVLTGSLPVQLPSAPPEIPVQSPEPDAHMADIEMRLKALEVKQVQLEQNIPTAASAPAFDMQELAGLKAGLVSIAGSLAKMQEDLSKTSQKTAQVSASAETGLASIVAFVQMHTTAFAGKPYEAERLTLRKTLANDQAALDLLANMEKAAVSGVPTIQALQHQWEPLAYEAQSIIRKAAAKTWQDRIIVALESLIAVRKLGGSNVVEPMSIASVDLDIAHDKLGAAIEKIDAFPPEARDVLKNWREQALLRLAAENDFNALATHLIDRIMPKVEPPAVNGETTP